MLLIHLQKLPNNVGNLGKIIVATGFECLPKKQKIAQSGHTGSSKSRTEQMSIPFKYQHQQKSFFNRIVVCF